MQNSPKPKNERLRARQEFERKMFLLFALRSLYRHYVRPPMIKNWIEKLKREVKADCKGRRQRSRGRLIRFGKRLIHAIFQKKNNEISELREGYTETVSCSFDAGAKMYGADQYDYTERRARKALNEALQAFGRNKPVERIPTMDEAAEQREKENSSEEYFLNDPEETENGSVTGNTDGMTSWTEPFNRPSEEEVNAMLKNACDDNICSGDEANDEVSSPSTIQSKSQKADFAYLPGFEGLFADGETKVSESAVVSGASTSDSQVVPSKDNSSTCDGIQPQGMEAEYLPGFEMPSATIVPKPIRKSRSKWLPRVCCHPEIERQ